MIDCLYRDEIRNAFSHSDYILTNTHFRWSEGSLRKSFRLNRWEAT